MSNKKTTKIEKTTQAELEKTIKEDKVKKKYVKTPSTETKKDVDENITLEEIVLFAQKCIDKKISKEGYDAFVKKLNIKSYLPLEKKAQILISFIMQLVYTEGFVSEMAAIDLEMRKLFRCLLAYTDMDINSVDAYPIDFSTYDVIVESGLYDYIFSICEKDYKRLEKLIEQAISFESVLQVSMNMAQLNPEEMHSQIKDAEKFMQGFSSKDIEHFAQIATLQDPLVHDIANMIRDNKL